MNDNDKEKQAIALRYDGANPPLIAAKGEGELAEAIIKTALEHGIHLHEDENLLALLATLELGEEIPRNLYIAVAEVIAFVYWLNGKVSVNKASE